MRFDPRRKHGFIESVTQIYERKFRRNNEEQIFGEAFVRGAYEESGLLSHLVQNRSIQKLTSRLVGRYYASRLSKRLIAPFIQKYAIEMPEFIVPSGGYNSFNDFFIRQLQPGQRSFPQEASRLGAPAEGRLSVFPLTSEKSILTIKGTPLSLAEFVGSQVLAQQFVGGHAFVFRLCPVDYHRFHFPDAGRAGPSTRLGRDLHSVNPLAVQKIPDVFLKNERQICLFESRNFGQLLLMEVGAICVGKIIQTYTPGQKIERGQEKGYFAFGGSTTVMLTQKLWVKPDADLIEKTNEGLESLVRLGDPIAHAGLTPSP